ncbi:MAG: FxsA family protein, partial [Pseudomonadota bacterium]
MWLLIAFIAVPMIEIALFIQVGGAIGLSYTLAIVLLTA